MKKKVRMFAAGFLVTAVLLGTLCGFMAVDLSTDRYMPGQFGPILQVGRIDGGGVSFSVMGSEYRLSTEPLAEAGDLLLRYRGLIPAHLRASGAAAVRLYERISQSYANLRETGSLLP